MGIILAYLKPALQSHLIAIFLWLSTNPLPLHTLQLEELVAAEATLPNPFPFGFGLCWVALLMISSNGFPLVFLMGAFWRDGGWLDDCFNLPLLGIGFDTGGEAPSALLETSFLML